MRYKAALFLSLRMRVEGSACARVRILSGRTSNFADAVTSLSGNDAHLPALCGTEGSLSCSQAPATQLCVEQLESTPYCLKIRFNIILPFTLRSQKWSLSFRFRDKNVMYACCMPRFYLRCLFYSPNNRPIW
jgi:hypothetical protein